MPDYLPIYGYRPGKVFGILMLQLFYSVTALADWDLLTFNREKTVHIWIESASVQRREDHIFVWVLYDREYAAEDGAMSSKLLNQYDCTNRQVRTWRQSYYAKSMAGGEKMPPKGKQRCEVGDALDVNLDDECTQTWKPIFDKTTGSAKVEVMDAQGVLLTEANVVASGCNLAVPEGQSGLLDDDNALLPGTDFAHWSMVDFKAGSNKIAVILAGHTCLAALANTAL